MSLAARQALVAHKNTIFQRDSQRTDLLDPALTDTALIALFTELCVIRNWPIEFTAIKSDHHDDACLGPANHFDGKAADFWPLHTDAPGAYLDAGDPLFGDFLHDLADAAWTVQVGLGGSAWTAQNMALLGAKGFTDNGADHVHAGV